LATESSLNLGDPGPAAPVDARYVFAGRALLN